MDGASTLTSLTCAIKKNEANGPTLVAGSMTPIVFLKGIGIVKLKPGVTPIQVSLITTSITSASNGNNGGYEATITGSGFPLDSSKINITLCGKKATVKSIQNTNLKIIVPSCASVGAQALSITLNGLTNTNLQFAYTDASATAPTITSVTPSSSNPAMKGKLTVAGTGFGSDSTKINAYLSNSTGRIYQLIVLSTT